MPLVPHDERMERNGQRMIAKDHFYYHPAPNELAGICFHYLNEDISIFLQIGLIPLPLCTALFIMWNERHGWKNGEKWSKNDRKGSFLLPSSTKLTRRHLFSLYFREDSSIFLQIDLIPLQLYHTLFIMGKENLCWKNGEKWSENDRKGSFLLPSSTKWTRRHLLSLF